MSNPWKEIRDAVWARAFEGGFTSPQLLVALRLVEHFPNIFPGEQKLARWTRLGVSTVRQAIAELEAARILRVTRNPGRVNQYEFLDRAGNPITQGVPDIGPTPPGAGGAPRQELDHTPPGAGSPTPPGAGSEADPDLKQDPKRVREAGRAGALEATPHPGVLRTIPEGYEPSEALVGNAALAGVSRAALREAIARLSTGPIGGSRGVLPGKLEEYILIMAKKETNWTANDAARRGPVRTEPRPHVPLSPEQLERRKAEIRAAARKAALGDA